MNRATVNSKVRKGTSFLVLPLFLLYSFSAFGGCSSHNSSCVNRVNVDCHNNKSHGEHKAHSTKKNLKAQSGHDHSSHSHHSDHQHKKKIDKSESQKVSSSSSPCFCESPVQAFSVQNSNVKYIVQFQYSFVTILDTLDLETLAFFSKDLVPKNLKAPPLYILKQTFLI